MNVVKLKINPYQNTNTISINDKVLSSYSELNNFIKRPFLEWAHLFYETVEKEVYGEYKVIVVSGEFENILLSKLRAKYPSCIEYIYEEFEVNAKEEVRLETLEKLGKKYLEEYVRLDNKLFICDEAGRKIPIPMGYQATLDKEQASIIIVTNELAALDLANKKSGKFIIYFDNTSRVSRVHKSYILGLTMNKAYNFLEAFVKRQLYMPRIIYLYQQLIQKIETLTEEEARQLALAIQIDTYVWVNVRNEIEIGVEVPIEYKVIPPSASIPQIQAVVLNQRIASCDGKQLVGLTEGQTTIEFYKSLESTPFYKTAIRVSNTHTIEKMALSLDEMVMGVGKTQQANIEIYPEDAEDIEELEWISSDPQVAKVSEEGKIKTISEGKCIITLKGRRTQAELELTVRPQIKKITLSQNQWCAHVGDKQPIEVLIAPIEVYNREYRWFTTDETVAFVEMQDDGQEVMRAVGRGSCMITCQAVDGIATTSVAVIVSRRTCKRNDKHTWLSLCAISSILFFAFCTLKFDTGIIFSALLTWLLGIVAIISNKRDWLWVVILMLLIMMTLLMM